MKICYVVLHYNSYEMSCECIDSLIKIKGINNEIVVVDNNSTNNSGQQIKEKYGTSIHILLADSNLGFAKGNNLGYLYAKNVLKADIIIDINNDIIITQEDFERLVYAVVVRDASVGIIAPEIINSKGQYQNPFRIERMSSFSKIKNLISNIFYYFCLRLNISRERLIRRYQQNVPITKSGDEYSNMYDIVPHGSCVIFTPAFVKKSDYAFVPITFFYGEEDILFDYVRLLELRTYYCKEIIARHMEKVATKTVSKNQVETEVFKTKNRIISICQNLKYRIKNKLGR